MARNLNNPALHRDYGATSSTSSTSAITSIPDVNFSGFSPTEFMSLSDNIGYNINSVISSWKQLDKALKVIGTPRDTQASRDKVHHLQSQTNIRIQTTSKDLQRLTAVVRHADKQQKLKQEKLTNEFRQVVEKYSESQQKIAAAMKQVVLLSVNNQQQDDESSSQRGGDQDILIQQQKNTEASLQFEQNMLLDQERRIKEIESDVLDVNSIFRVLSSLVQEQGEQVDLVENSIDMTNAAVIDGAAELRKAAEYRASYRRKILILLAIAVIIGLIVTGIIVGKLNS
ncbi:syntaxin-12 [Eupeodes corollae]|uniref:syntaxin-12 n=1 Tax=Eupeodes corollae TaxID=290404 RepID=UPI00249141B5|nr:syntaxin-12 [Eupeodes corollae]XP_055923945.1 syntaxin-12 [Eupeodes corollae]XP_055923946.1 syntaxin-12 [Eupeodes corollae]